MGYIFTNNTNAVISSTTAETTMFPAGTGTRVIPANTLAPGSIVRVVVSGSYITDAVAPTLRIRCSLTGGSTQVLGDTGANATPAVASGLLVHLEYLFIVSALGASGTVKCHGYTLIGLTSTTAAVWHMSTTSATVDTTVDKTIDATAQWGTSNANNQLTAAVTVVELSGT